MERLLDIETLTDLVKEWKAKGESLVFTNGCFDILHIGHASYLESASRLADHLVVAVNTDASVKRLGKDDNRPINNENARAALIASLRCVDASILFDEDTPLELILRLKPNLLVKGDDYDALETDPNSKSYVVGSKEVKEYGGEVRTIALVDGYSTTELIRRIKED